MRILIAALVLCIISILTAASATPTWWITVTSDADDHPGLMGEIASVINEVATEYPEVRGVTLTTEIMINAYAYATRGKIVFNDLYTSDPEIIESMIATDVMLHFHPALGWCSGAQYLAYHESAHIIHRARDGSGAIVAEIRQRFGDGESLRGILPGYSFNKEGFHPTEALAEAFAAVKCNGGNETEQELFRILTK